MERSSSRVALLRRPPSPSVATPLEILAAIPTAIAPPIWQPLPLEAGLTLRPRCLLALGALALGAPLAISGDVQINIRDLRRATSSTDVAVPGAASRPVDPIALLAERAGSILSGAGEHEVFRERSLEQAVSLGGRGNIQFGARAQLIRADDAIITGDEYRALYTKKRASGRIPLSWLRTVGDASAGIGFALPFPVGAATISLGFDADANVRYSVLAPYAVAPEALAETAANMSIDLPLDLDRAFKLPDGAEVVFCGSARMAARAGGALGTSLAKLGLVASVGASAGIDVAISTKIEVCMRIQKRDGKNVYVNLSVLQPTTLDAGAKANVGLDLTLSEHVPDLGSDLLRQAIDTQILDLESEPEAWASAGVEARHTVQWKETRLASFAFEKNSAEAKKAYADLFRLYTPSAQALAQRSKKNGVRWAQFKETLRFEDDSFDAHLGKLDILVAASRSGLQKGTLSTPEGNFDFYSARVSKSHSSVFTNADHGKQSVVRRFVTLKGPAESEPKAYFELEYKVRRDRKTTAADVHRFVTLAPYLGIVPPSLPVFGKTTHRSVHVFINDRGLDLIAEMVLRAPEDFRRIFAETYTSLERPFTRTDGMEWKVAPWSSPDPRAQEAMELLTGARAVQYSAMTGRTHEDDLRAYKMMLSLEELIRTVAGEANLEARAERFRVLGSSVFGFDFMPGLGTAARIAGAKNVLVSNYTIEDCDRKLALGSGRGIEHPDIKVRSTLAKP